MKRTFIGLSAALALAACGQPKYVKQVTFPEGATLEEKVEMAARVVPTEQQLAWQQLELTAFMHFGINTFTGREWGDGHEDPALFNPEGLDADQWVRTLRDAGFRMVILTAKHHDGFCLWPTKTTRHSVASSAWKEGRGDVVRELRDACSRYDMKFGVYLSPWDRNAACYGDSPAYNKFLIEQLTELLTNYGEVHEVWFDGACGEGPNGKKQEYDWDAFFETIHRLQPRAVTAIMGDDVRWVGNERGLGRETEWSATVLIPSAYPSGDEQNARLGISATAADLGSREVLARATQVCWYPSEVDVSIRPGWFWHPWENGKVKNLKQLTDIYFQSVGCNSVLLLNIPPDRRGRIHAADSVRLMEFARYRSEAFADDRVRRGDRGWSGAAGTEHRYELLEGSRINTVLLQEDIARGQRVEAFEVEALTDAGWQPLCAGTTIGYKRLLRFPETAASALRVRIVGSRTEANIARVAAYLVPEPGEGASAARWNDLPREGWQVRSESPFVVDLGRSVALRAFTYAPADAEARPDMAFRYTFSVSDDGRQWRTVVADGEFGNIMHNPLPQTVALDEPVVARYVRLEATAPDGARARIAADEFGVSCAE